MTRQRQLSKAPLREALIDIQFEPGAGLPVFEGFSEVVSKEYPICTDLWEAYFNISEAQDGPKTEMNSASLGKRFASAENRYVIQCRRDGLTVSRLNPYGKWEDLLAETKKWWTVVNEVGKVEAINRLAVRYINALDLPLPLNDLGDFLAFPPRFPASSGSHLSSFLNRVVFSNFDKDCMTIVNQVLEDQSLMLEAQKTVTVVLDIDVFSTTRFPSHDEAHMWARLNVLRSQKNQVFFDYITDRTAEIYE